MPKKGCLGCSFPLTVGILVVFLALIVIGFLAGPLGPPVLAIFGLKVTLPSWLSVSQPKLELPAAAVFHIFGFPITNSVISAWLTIIVLVSFSYAVSHRLRIIPTRWQALLEFIIGALLSFCQSVAGEKNGRRFFPIVTTIFLFVLFNAWLSLLPGFGTILVHTHEGETHLLRGANTDINLPLALALVSFVFVEYFGFKSHNIRYLEKFFNVGGFLGSLRLLFSGKFKAGLSGLMMGAINIFVGLIETLSEFIRIVSFTFRLFGNMTAGEILLLMMMFLISYVVATLFYGFELIFGFVQALIFAGLTLIFLTLAVASHGEERH